MNYHDDKWIMDKVQEHYSEALEYFPSDRIVCLILQGSQNYGLDTPESDIDTKLILTPSFKDIAMNRKAISTTHVRDNNEHIDWKDIRLYIQTFRKQNLNFLEILFSKYAIINKAYYKQWSRLIETREDIARFNIYRGVQSMKGIAMEKYHALKHPYPSQLDVLEKYGYSPKQLHHLMRVEEYLARYIDGEPYEDCLTPRNPETLIKVKQGCYNLEQAELIAEKCIANITNMAEHAYTIFPNEENPEVNELLDDVQYEIMKIAIKKEIGD